MLNPLTGEGQMKMMKMFNVVALVIGIIGVLGCEWEQTEDGFNTSQGAGSTVNFSGFYSPRSGAYLFGSNITHIIISQIGNTIEVRDSNNSYYSGSVGSPGIMSSVNPSTGAYPAGAEVLQAQINFSGRNAASGGDVSFAGIIHAVAVDDVKGITTSSTTTANVTDSGTKSTNSTSTTTIGIVAPPATINNSTVITDNQTGTQGNTQNSTTGNTTTYSVTEANTQYVLEGNWVEGSGVFVVDAIAPAAVGSFSTTTP
jgi:hypothetical protein